MLANGRWDLTWRLEGYYYQVRVVLQPIKHTHTHTHTEDRNVAWKRCSLWNLYEQIHGYQKLDEIKRQYIYYAVASNRMGLEASPEM